MGRGPLLNLLLVSGVYAALAAVLRLLCDSAGLSDAHSGIGGVASLYLHLSLLCSAGYALVSLNMRRPLAHAWCSRYGGLGEFAKMQRLLPWLMLAGLVAALRRPTPAEIETGAFHSTPHLLFPAHSGDDGAAGSGSATAAAATATLLQPLASLPLGFVVGFFFALHFTFLDGSATLQSLGCKLPLPSLWPHLTPKEVVIIVGSAVAVTAALLPSILSLLRDESWAWVAASFALLCAAQIYLADMTHTGGGGGGGSSRELDAPMSGWLMWRHKAAQLVPGLAWLAPSQSSPSQSPSSPSSPPPLIYLHVHHYLWGVLLLPLLRFPCPSSVLAAGACLAVAVEGVACWGMDPLLVAKRPIEPESARAAAAAAAAAAAHPPAAVTEPAASPAQPLAHTSADASPSSPPPLADLL